MLPQRQRPPQFCGIDYFDLLYQKIIWNANTDIVNRNTERALPRNGADRDMAHLYRRHRVAGPLQVFHNDSGGVSQRDRVRRDIGQHDAINADNGAFPNRDTLQNENVVTDPGIPAYSNRPDLLGRWRKIRNTGSRVARMCVCVHETDAGRNIHVILDDDFLVDDEGDIVTNVYPILNDKTWLIEDAAAEYVDLTEDVDVVTDIDFGVTDDKRKPSQRQVFSDRGATGSKQGLPIEIARDPTKCVSGHVLEPKHAAQQRVKDAGNGQIAFEQPFCARPQPAIQGRLSATYLQN